MLGDAREEFLEVAARSGRWRASTRYWFLALSVGLRFMPGRLAPRARSGTFGVVDGLQVMAADFHHAGRIVYQRPGLTLVAVVTFALGTAAPATMFSISSGVLSDLPFEEGHRIVAVQMNDPVRGSIDMGVPVDDYRMWSGRQTSLEALGGVNRRIVQVSGAAQAPPALFDAAAMTPNAVSLLRVTPVLGRPFESADAQSGSVPVVIIGYRVWQELFGGDPGVLGAELRVNDEMRTVVGVMPEGFEFPFEEQIWLPLSTYAGADVEPLSVFGRLRDGVSLATASADFDAIARVMASERPETHGDLTITVQNYARAGLGPDASAGVIMMYALTLLMSFVLVIACVNVSNLLLVHALGRTREIAVRMALGASRTRIIRHLLAESVVIASIGGLAGMFLAARTAKWFDDRIANQVNLFWITVEFDLLVVAFCVGIVTVAAVCSGLLPAWVAAGIDLRSAIEDGNRGSTSFRASRINRVLVTAEIALSCALLILSGLMVRGVLDLVAKDAAFGQDRVLTGRIMLQEFDYAAAQSRRALWYELQRKIEAQPGTEAVAITTRLPGIGVPQWRIEIPGLESQDNLGAARIQTTPSFFQIFDVRLVEGRLFSDADHEGTTPVAVVTRAFAEELFPDGGALGRRLRFATDADTTWIHVVGVVEDGGVFSRDGTVRPGVYQPLRQTAPMRGILAIRTRTDPLAHVGSVRADLASIDPHLPLHEVDTLQGRLVEASRFERTLGSLFGTFGIVALVMATVGLYGVVSFGVSRRRQELGIRKALGAQRVSIVWVVLRGAAVSLLIGLGLGVGVALLLAPATREALFGRSPTDVGVYVTVVATLSAAALAAALIPSVRAARVDPVTALRR